MQGIIVPKFIGTLPLLGLQQQATFSPATHYLIIIIRVLWTWDGHEGDVCRSLWSCLSVTPLWPPQLLHVHGIDSEVTVNIERFWWGDPLMDRWSKDYKTEKKNCSSSSSNNNSKSDAVNHAHNFNKAKNKKHKKEQLKNNISFTSPVYICDISLNFYK